MRRNGPAVIGQLPCAPGVYRFRDAGGRVLYVGPATTLRSRVASYWSDLRDREHLGPMVARVAQIEAVACDSVHEAAWLERNLLETSLPRWNRTPGGQESAVYIKMDTRPAAPGLSVAYRLSQTPRCAISAPILAASGSAGRSPRSRGSCRCRPPEPSCAAPNVTLPAPGAP